MKIEKNVAERSIDEIGKSRQFYRFPDNSFIVLEFNGSLGSCVNFYFKKIIETCQKLGNVGQKQKEFNFP